MPQRKSAPKKASRKRQFRPTPAAVEANRKWAELKDEQDHPFRFEFLGFRDGWYALRANLKIPHGAEAALDIFKGGAALHFENEVIEWLIAQRITPGKYSHIGNGNVGDGPWLPAVHDGSAMCVLLKRAVDVTRFEMRFPCVGITPDTMLDALRAEARIVRIGAVEIAQVAYDANRRLNLIHQKDYPTWDDCSEEHRQMVIAIVQNHMEHPDWTEEQIHDRWMEASIEAGWTYGSKRDFDRKTHPSLIPFDRLTALEKAKDNLFGGVVRSLLPLMEE